MSYMVIRQWTQDKNISYYLPLPGPVLRPDMKFPVGYKLYLLASIYRFVENGKEALRFVGRISCSSVSEVTCLSLRTKDKIGIARTIENLAWTDSSSPFY